MLSLLSDTPRHINLADVGVGLLGLRGPMHLCACVSGERSYLCCQIQSSGSTKAHTP